MKISRNVTVDVDVYNAAKEKGLNISEACEEGLRARLSRTERKGRDPLGKLRGLPVHVVANIKKAAMRNDYQLGKVLDNVNMFYEREITKEDAKALVPRF